MSPGREASERAVVDEPQSDMHERIALLVSAEAGARNSQPFTVAGKQWIVKRDSGAARLPDYCCVSYSWGPSRIAHPLQPDQRVSVRALPVLEAASAVCDTLAIWLDAFCVPFDEPSRTATIRSMGAIYGGATRVAVVLSPECAAAIDHIARAGEVDEADLTALEADDWVTRAWTYQECANSAEVRFCAERSTSTWVTGSELLDAVGKALSDYGKSRALDAFAVARRFPGLDALQDTLAEWMIGGVEERTALQVMTAVGLRSPDATAKDRLDAMIGAIDPQLATTHASEGMDPANVFMQACESKGEYSFIYTSAPRGGAPGQSWQPAAEFLPAILSWHSFGDGQPGVVTESGLTLGKMARARPGAMSHAASAFIGDFLRAEHVEDTDRLAERVLRRLRQAGFSGSGSPVELQEGILFPQRLAPPPDATIWIAAGVRWAFGAPALVLLPGAAGAFAFGDVAVFVGPPPAETTSVTIV